MSCNSSEAFFRGWLVTNPPTHPRLQVGFYDFIALPLVHALATAFPGARPLLACFVANYDHWRAAEKAAAAEKAEKPHSHPHQQLQSHSQRRIHQAPSPEPTSTGEPPKAYPGPATEAAAATANPQQ